MVNPGLTIKLFDFQEQAVLKLLDLTAKQTSKQTVVMKAPTGSGKTIILIDYVDEYLTNVNNNTAFIWLCPGKGNLEEQSRDKMQKIAPHRTTQNLFDSLLNGFTPGSTTFINWELVTKKGNTAIRDSERKNLFERIADAHRNGIEFILKTNYPVTPRQKRSRCRSNRGIIDSPTPLFTPFCRFRYRSRGQIRSHQYPRTSSTNDPFLKWFSYASRMMRIAMSTSPF